MASDKHVQISEEEYAAYIALTQVARDVAYLLNARDLEEAVNRVVVAHNKRVNYLRSELGT